MPLIPTCNVLFVWQEQSMSELLTVKVRLPSDNMDQGSYVIDSMSASDEGTYICRATNSLGSQQASVDVHMLGTYHVIIRRNI